jgi:hypothetical protein
VNYSDIRGQAIGGKWSPKPGPIQGLSLGYSFNRIIGLETGINYSTIYYEHLSSLMAAPIYYDYYDYVAPYPIIRWPVIYSEIETMDFTFLRIPLLFALSLPAEVQFDLRTGLYYSFLLDYNLQRNYPIPEGAAKPKKDDYGFIFSTGISYPVGDNLMASLNASYITGRRIFLESYETRHGSSEFTIGLAYTGFHLGNKTDIVPKSRRDSLSDGIAVVFTGGMNYSWNQGTKGYSGHAGPAFGFNLKFPFGRRGASFQTGFLFESKGYSLKDSSASFYKYLDGQSMYYVDTDVETTYAVIPALLNFPLGSSERFFFTTGPWFGLKLNARTAGTAYNEIRSRTRYELIKTTVYDDLEKAMKGWDAGWIFSCGASFPVVKNYKVELSLQYHIGFRNVFDAYGAGGQGNPHEKGFNIRNRTLSLLLGFSIPSKN